jgi:hypothetical protein
MLEDDAKCAATPANLSRAELTAAASACFPPDEYFLSPPAYPVPRALFNQALAVQAGLTGLPLSSLPQPSSLRFQVWDEGGENAGAGVHLWSAGSKWWEIHEQVRQPRSKEAVYIVGEVFSNVMHQGWVEGALESVEKTLTKKWLESSD